MFSLERDEEMRRLAQESHRLVMTSVNSKLVSGSGAPPNDVSTLRQTKFQALLLTLLSTSNMSLKNITVIDIMKKALNDFDSMELLFSYKSKFYCKSQLYYQYGPSVCLHTIFKEAKINTV